MPAQIQSLSHLSTLKSTITTVQELSSRVLALQRWRETGETLGNLALADLTIDTFNVSGPQAKGLYFDGVNKLSLSAADATRPGAISTGAQVIPGAKTFPALITASLGATSGAATLPLTSALGATSGDILLKLGSTVASGSMASNAKLVSFRTGIGGVESEKGYLDNTGKLSINAELSFGRILRDTSALGIWGVSGIGNGQTLAMFETLNNLSSGYLLKLLNFGTVKFSVDVNGVTNVVGNITAANLSGTNTGDITLAAFGTSPNANGATLTGQVLNLEPASISRPGGVSTVAQVFSGVKTMHVEGNNTTLATLSSNELQIESSKGTPNVPVLKLISFTTPVAQFYSSTAGAAVVEGLLSLALIAGGTTALTAASTGNVTITGAVTASNLSGTNTGDVTIGAFSATPSSVGATLTVPQIINLTAADATNPGGVSINAQTFGGVKTADGWTGTNANTSTTIGVLTAQLRAVATGASGIPVVEFVGNGTTRGIIFGGTTGNFGYNAVGGSHVFFNNGTSLAAITPTEVRPATAGGLDLGSSTIQWARAYLTSISLKGTINGTAGTSATANNASGRNVLSSGSTTYTITNSLVSTSSIILVTVNSTGQATSSTVRAVPAAGSFTVVFSSAVTADTTFSWLVLAAF